MTNILDCVLEQSTFELQSRHYIPFQTNTLGKGMKTLILPAIDSILPMLYFYKDGFGIK